MTIIVAITMSILVAARCWRATPRGGRWLHHCRVVRAEAPRGIAELEAMLADHAPRSGHPRSAHPVTAASPATPPRRELAGVAS